MGLERDLTPSVTAMVLPTKPDGDEKDDEGAPKRVRGRGRGKGAAEKDDSAMVMGEDGSGEAAEAAEQATLGRGARARAKGKEKEDERPARRRGGARKPQLLDEVVPMPLKPMAHPHQPLYHRRMRMLARYSDMDAKARRARRQSLAAAYRSGCGGSGSAGAAGDAEAGGGANAALVGQDSELLQAIKLDFVAKVYETRRDDAGARAFVSLCEAEAEAARLKAAAAAASKPTVADANEGNVSQFGRKRRRKTFADEDDDDEAGARKLAQRRGSSSSSKGVGGAAEDGDAEAGREDEGKVDSAVDEENDRADEYERLALNARARVARVPSSISATYGLNGPPGAPMLGSVASAASTKTSESEARDAPLVTEADQREWLDGLLRFQLSVAAMMRQQQQQEPEETGEQSKEGGDAVLDSISPQLLRELAMQRVAQLLPAGSVNLSTERLQERLAAAAAAAPAKS